jgi:LPPG:FO 2-phospho-L-lactate transferase
MTTPRRIIALCGGVGGAKLALGLSRVLPPKALTIVVNTADDFVHMGLPISPDLDTVMYTLARVVNPETGWGRLDESWQCMDALADIGGETWFRLGDKDLALHLERRRILDQGNTLSHVTTELCKTLGVTHPVIPMSDDYVSTMVITNEREIPFQHYFVREQCEPKVSGFRFDGIESASPSPAFSAALEDNGETAILICPSNPFISIDPILQIPGIRTKIQEMNIPVFAVSPIVGGKAIKGPTAKMFRELGKEVSAPGVCKYYGDLLTGFIADTTDLDVADGFPSSVNVEFTNTLMKTTEDKIVLAQDCLRIISTS